MSDKVRLSLVRLTEMPRGKWRVVTVDDGFRNEARPYLLRLAGKCIAADLSCGLEDDPLKIKAAEWHCNPATRPNWLPSSVVGRIVHRDGRVRAYSILAYLPNPHRSIKGERVKRDRALARKGKEYFSRLHGPHDME